MTDPVLSIRDVTYTYPDGRRAVTGFSFDVRASESVGIIGPNGAGKTTLLQVVAGLLEPEDGDVRIFGKACGKHRTRDARRHTGFVFQETEDQLFCPTVFDDVAFGPLHFGFPADEVPVLVAEALGHVGLGGYEERVSHHLSSGERRRVAIASVLSYRPDILLLDEPTSDLDPRGRRALARVLEDTWQTRIVASHDLEFILLTCRRVLLVESGELRAEGATTDVLASTELLEEHGLEAPLGLRDLDSAALERLAEEHRGKRPGTATGLPG